MVRGRPRGAKLDSMAQGPVVSTQWLAERLGDPGTRVVDCRWYLRPFDGRNGDDEYAKAHIPGAVHARWDTELADPDRPDLWMLAGPERFAGAMSSPRHRRRHVRGGL